MAEKKADWGVILPRIERYGLSTVLLVLFCVWARPHIDGLINDMRATMKETSASVKTMGETQSRQTEIQSQGIQSLQRIESKADRLDATVQDHGIILRDVQSRIRDSPTASQ